PRLVGTAQALRMIQTGKPIDAQAALKAGLVDAIADNDLLDTALAFAQTCAANSSHPVIGQRAVEAGAVDFDAARDGVRAKARNALAQRAAIDCVEAATRLPFEAGLDEERRCFDELVAGNVSKALRHLFFAEKEAPRIVGA